LTRSDKVVPVLEVAFLAFIENLGGDARADALDAVQFGSACLVHVDSGKAGCGVQHGHEGQNFLST